jgi:hypothetical protein
MRKSLRGFGTTAILLALLELVGSQVAAPQESPPATGYSVLSRTLLERAKREVERVRALVDQGALPRSELREAEARLADAQDDLVLSQTLYGQAPLEDMTVIQTGQMVAAAERRVERERTLVNKRREFLKAGIISQSELEKDEEELISRERVLQLARSREELMEQLRRMAESEKRLQQAAAVGAARDAMVRYDGDGQFSLHDLTTISSSFEQKFHHALPVSAKGQTLVHQSMLLDHSNRVDVALVPDQAEGIWLRHFLEQLHIPYIAFRTALAGAATAPHIHIGPGSTRLRLAER